jgi:hypothetical protein
MTLEIIRDVFTLAVIATKIQSEPINKSSNNGDDKNSRGILMAIENRTLETIFTLDVFFMSNIFLYTYKETIRSPKNLIIKK